MRTFIADSNKFYGHYQVVYPSGHRVDCHNLATAISIRNNSNKELHMSNNDNITTIQGVIDCLEEYLEAITDLHDRRPIIQIIEFCQRAQDLNRDLNDIIYWLQRELPKGLDKALSQL